ncbi:hypothetical protein DRZ77_02525 [Candidatus Woesearchaeota archaeon]|nr:hypothetical protein [Candidatus Woesearchaeota archaeon]RLE40341.1 MAG: hypothetical protein DRZ77_02525 [Candidatus Woesearchaeota archaeon]
MKKIILIFAIAALLVSGCVSPERQELQKRLTDLKQSVEATFPLVENLEIAKNRLIGGFYTDPFFPNELIKKKKGQVADVKSKLLQAESNINSIKAEVDSLKENKLLTENQRKYINVLSESYKTYTLYLNTLNKMLADINNYLNFQSHYIKFYEIREDMYRHISSASIYVDANEPEKAKPELNKAKELIIKAEREINDAEKFIAFDFIKEWKNYMALHSKYIDAFAEAVNLTALKKYPAANKKFKESSSYLAEAKISKPNDAIVREQMAKIKLDVFELKDKVEYYLNNAQEIYKSLSS